MLMRDTYTQMRSHTKACGLDEKFPFLRDGNFWLEGS